MLKVVKTPQYFRDIDGLGMWAALKVFVVYLDGDGEYGS